METFSIPKHNLTWVARQAHRTMNPGTVPILSHLIAPPPALHSAETSVLQVAQDVLNTEAVGLVSLGEQFGQAIDRLASATGRVVVSGMGKSGHVGRKIAATLASTGTPALFVHPAEASHGDLGMIVAGDAVLVLSNSGETSELADLVAYARRFALPLIAITARSESALAQAADVALILPPAAEACPIGLAPTTSTTMQMAPRRRDHRRVADAAGLYGFGFSRNPPGRAFRCKASPCAGSDAHR